ncbi:hypothetical protein V3C99_007907 [Haemonchus contortus]|uniref:Protein F09G8.5 n=1 Tax=Haemonchus contortus TaxID=6289 RepID=A0A7I4YPB9_HAECO
MQLRSRQSGLDYKMSPSVFSFINRVCGPTSHYFSNTGHKTSNS